LAFAIVFGLSAPASAHEQQGLAGGKYNVVVGWGDEPAYNGFKNSVQVLLSDAAHKPVADLKDTLRVEVVTGDQRIEVALEPNFEVGEFGEPGDYRGWIVPTRPGNYTFHLTGTIRGDKIDESFTSSDTTFDPVKDLSEVEFPAKDPTAGQVSQRLDRESARLGARMAALQRTVDKDSKATTALVVGIAGLVLGVLALGVSVMRRR
jgi:hypothetical protein